MIRIIKYTLLDILRNRIVLLYSIVLLFVPLVSMIFSTIYYYKSSEFIELLLAQPIRRSSLFFSMYNGLSLSLALAFVLGCGIPVLIFDGTATGLLLVAVVCCSLLFSPHWHFLLRCSHATKPAESGSPNYSGSTSPLSTMGWYSSSFTHSATIRWTKQPL